MRLADQIRHFVNEEYIQTAWVHAKFTVSNRAGYIHKDMGLHNRMPAVCAAMDTQKSKELARVQLRERAGP